MGFHPRLLGSVWFARVAQWNAPSSIKSIQRGTITITGAATGTATITAVDPNNCVLRFLGQTYSAASTSQNEAFARLTFTNATTITGTVDTSPGAASTIVSFEVTEYQPGVIKSVQRGTIIGTTTATITEVNPRKSDLCYLGHTEAASDGVTQYMPRIVLTNATTITQTVVVNSVTTTSWQVVEWY